MKKLNNKRAFTIVELIIVIAVIGVLAAILIPAFTNIIAKANYKSAISDARGALTNFLAANLEVVDGTHVKHIAIFVKKADKYYAFGYTSDPNDPHAGELTESFFSPYSHDSLVEMVNEFNCTPQDIENNDIGGKAFCLIPTNGGGKSMSASDEEALNQDYQNAVDLIDGLSQSDLPESTLVFNGFLLANTIMPVPDQVYKIPVTLYDAFNKNSIGDREILVTLPPTAKSFTLNDETFSKFVSGYVPYYATDEEPKMEHVFTINKLQMDVRKVTINVAPTDIIDGVEYIRVERSWGYRAINEKPSNLSKNYILTASPAGFNTAPDITPIGKQGGVDIPFTGIFDGAGYIISGARYQGDEQDNIGLFAINSGTIKNLKVTVYRSNTSFSGKNNVGAITGRNVGGTIYNCSVETIMGSKVEIFGTGQNVGMVAGTNESGGIIEYCYTYTFYKYHVVGSTVGGVAGFNDETSIITRCTAAASIAGYDGATRIGGIAGYSLGTITECLAGAYINFDNKTQSYVGGLVGELEGPTSANPNAKGILENCYAYYYDIEQIKATDYAGKLVGYATAANITNCCVLTRNITDVSNVNYGIGYVTEASDTIPATVVENTYICVTTTGTELGGEPYNVTEVFNYKQLSAKTSSIWDLENIWDCPTSNYPSLRRTKKSA